MAIVQLNPTGFSYSEMLTTLNKSYKTQTDITISNLDNDLASEVQAGSIFANNGALFENDTDVTPTGYSGITVSTTFYLYYDADTTKTFIYSETIPVWDDDKQGWYNGNNRAFFAIYKDSGGTLYTDKNKLTKPIARTVRKVQGASVLQSEVYLQISADLPNIGDRMLISGSSARGLGDNLSTRVFAWAERTSSTVITIYGTFSNIDASSGAILIQHGNLAFTESASGISEDFLTLAWESRI